MTNNENTVILKDNIMSLDYRRVEFDQIDF